MILERAWPYAVGAVALGLAALSGVASTEALAVDAPPMPTHPVRIVALGLPADELALALVGPDRIVAIDRFADDPDASNVLDEARTVARRVAVGLEPVLACEPDLVLLPAWADPALEMGLHRFGVATLRVGHATSLDDVRANVRRVATALDAELEGAAVIASMDEAVARVRTEVQGRARPTVLLHAGSGYSPAAHTLFAELVEVAGGRPLLAEAGEEGLAPLGVEREMSLDPDVIVVDAYRADARGRELTGDVAFVSDRRFAHLRAVHEGRVAAIDARLLLTTTQHVAGAAVALAAALHGDVP